MAVLARCGVAVSCLTLVSSITAAVVAVPRPAGADQVSDLKAQAAHVSQQLVEEQLQVGGYEQQYEIADQKLQRDEQAIATTEQQISQDQQSVVRNRALVRRQALYDYTNSSGTLGGVQQLFVGSAKTAEVRSAYEQVATANVQNSIDQLQVAQSTLRSEQAVLEHQEAADQATTSQAAQLEEQAQNTQSQLQSLQAQVNGQLATAVAQQQAAEEAAAAAAIRNARGLSAGRALGDSQLPAFLQCVMQAESSGNYGAVSPGGVYKGAFQFSQATWDEAASLAGLPNLVGMPPNQATPAQQDALAIALYSADGERPWYDPCRGAG
ncbi:MAG: transglycosylase family protein [Nitrososphaerales archaeon]